MVRREQRGNRPPMGESAVILALLQDGDLSPERRAALRRLLLRVRAQEYGLLVAA
jgi:hypothetical protein